MMEQNCFIGKLARWAFIFHEYHFDIVHMVGKINKDVVGLSGIQVLVKDMIKACWHNDVDLEVIPK
jgi:hypothetical protein